MLPTIGLGALQPTTTAEESSVYDTPKEKNLYAPRRIEWSNLADQLAEAGVGVSIFMAPSNIIDVASIGTLNAFDRYCTLANSAQALSRQQLEERCSSIPCTSLIEMGLSSVLI